MALHARILATQAAIGGVLEEQGLPGAVLALSNLAGPVNAFFDGVMVMAEDPGVQANRLGLLQAVVELTRIIGDLSKLQE
jgi:glycyl-tRNA synthetase beta chain